MVKHYLISFPVPGACLHGYLMSNDRSHLEGAVNRVLKIAEDTGAPVFAPIVMVTELRPGTVKKIRKMLTVRSPDAGRTLLQATDFHISIWGMTEQDPQNRDLMGIH